MQKNLNLLSIFASNCTEQISNPSNVSIYLEDKLMIKCTQKKERKSNKKQK